ncbi:hypothetical protein [Streptomyces hesseae]|uniref:Uncharacterized protein n=1 Tax=Streptomyces hesseae TaxID=3075519 RepID=A0ABU2SNV2_9ACTN|nr:hypothetical protein [Streptomyces sp. DSM 40473]MDT0450438.1 hypothetical protein [Streptomyces sp. DSM 40473]
MTTETITAAEATTTGTAVEAGEEIKPLPTWFFCFEGLMSAAYDLFKAYPQSLWVLGALALVNLVASLTVLRSRLKLAKRLWRGKGTRKIALGLVALRLGSHLALGAAGLAVTGIGGHLGFAVVMAATTVSLLWFGQRAALRAIAAGRA